MPVDRLSIEQFAQRVKAKYPQYKDIDDKLLTQKMIEKYPQYKDTVTFEVPKQKEVSPERQAFINAVNNAPAPPRTSAEMLSSEVEQKKQDAKEFQVIKQKERELNEKKKNEAVENSTNLFFKNNPSLINQKDFGLTKKKATGDKFSLSQLSNFSPYQQKIRELKEGIEKGKYVVSNDNNGQPIVGRPLNWMGNSIGGIKDAWNSIGKANAYNNMTPEERVKYALEEAKPTEEYLPKKPDTQSGWYSAGSMIPSLAKMGAGIGTGAVIAASVPETGGAGTALPGLAGLTGWLMSVPDMAKQARMNTEIGAIQRLKSQHPDWNDQKIYNAAQEEGLVDYSKAIATGTAMNFLGQGMPAIKGNGLLKATSMFLKKQPESLAEMGLFTYGTDVAADKIRRAFSGEKESAKDLESIYGNMTSSMWMQLFFNAFHSTIAPKPIKAQANEIASQIPPEELQAAQQEAIDKGILTPEQVNDANANLKDYIAAKEKTNPTGDPEKDAVITGLIQKKQNVEKEKLSKDKSYHEDYDAQIDAIDERIKIAKNSDNPIKYAEQDDIDGSKNFATKPFEELSNKEMEGIVVPKEYGEADVKEMGEGENKKYKPVATVINKKGGLEISDKIPVEDKEFSSKEQAQKAAYKALAEHYYNNAMDETLKPEKKSSVTVIRPEENKAPNVVEQPVSSIEDEKIGKELGSDVNTDLSKTKVIDEKGNPLTVYHSTLDKFDDFKDGITYFAEDKDYSRHIAKLMNKEGRSSKDIREEEVHTIPVKLNAERIYELPKGVEMNGNYIKYLIESDPDFIKKYDAVKGIDLYSDNKIVYAVFDKKNIKVLNETKTQAKEPNQEAISNQQNINQNEQAISTSPEEMGAISRGQENGQGIRSEGGEQGGLETRQEGYQKNNGENQKEQGGLNASSIESSTTMGEQPSGAQSIRGTRSEGMGQSEQGIEPARTEGESKGEKEKISVHAEKPPLILTHRGLQELATDIGLEDVTPRERQSRLRQLKEANDLIDEWKNDGTYSKNVNDIIQRAKQGKIDEVEQKVLANHLATLREQLDKIRKTDGSNSEKYREKFNEAQEVKQSAQIMRSKAGGLLGDKTIGIPDDTFEGFLSQKQEANDGDELTPQQIAKTEKIYKEYEEKLQKEIALRQEAETKYNELLAQKELNKVKPKSTTGKKKTKEDYAAERQKFREELKAAKDEHVQFLKDNGIQKAGISGITLTPKMVKAISKIVASYVDEIGNNLKEVTEKVYEEVKEFFEGITKDDITDIIAGVHNEKRPALTKLQSDLSDVKEQARLIKKYEALISGEEPKTESAKRIRSEEINNLRQKIKDYKKEEIEANKFYGESDVAERKLDKLRDELDRIKERRQKEKPTKDSASEKEMSERETNLREEIKKEQEKWDREKEQARNLKKDYRKMETERNRQIEKIENIKTKIEQLSSGVKSVNKREIKLDTPEIESWKQKLKEAEKSFNELIASETKDFRTLQRLKAQAESATKAIEERIKNKEYTTPAKTSFVDNPEFKKKYPELYKKVLDAIAAREDAKHKLALDNYLDQQAKRKLGAKIADTFASIIATSRAIVSGIDDSFVFMQAYYAMLANPKIGKEAFKEHALDAWSEKRFNRELAALHNSKNWDVIQKSGLDVLEPKSLHEDKVEEMFDKNLLNKTIRLKNGKELDLKKVNFLRPFERAFTSMGNNMRVKLFLERMQTLQEHGKTFESNPEEYKAAARVINEMVGRGKQNKYIEIANPVITPFIWSPRLISSGLNLLGVSDLLSFANGSKWGTEGFYRKLTPKQRQYAFSQIGRGIGTGVAIMGIAALSGAQVDFDPRSVTFGNVTIGDIQINVFGRLAPYVKGIVQSITGTRVKEGQVQNINTGRNPKTVGGIWGSILRSKMTPSAGLGFDYFFNAGKDYYTKEKINPLDAVKKTFVPIGLQNIGKQIERDGSLATLEFLGSFFGLQINDKRDFQKENQVVDWDKVYDEYANSEDTQFAEDWEIHDPKTRKLRKLTDEEKKKVRSERDKRINQEIENIKKKGLYDLDEKGNPITIPFDKITNGQLDKEIKKRKTNISDNLKDELYPETTEEKHNESLNEQKLEHYKKSQSH